MILETFAVTWIGVVAAQASPGPNLAAVASIALGDGRRPALFAVLGIGIGMLVWAVSAALGLSAILEAFPLSLVLLRLVGGAYLIWLAIKAVRSILKGKPVTIKADHTALSDWQGFRRGVLVVLTNPKAVLMWAAVATFLFGAGLAPVQVVAFGPLGALSGLVIYGFYAWLFSTQAAVKSYARASRGIETIFAGAFATLGGRLIFDGLRELRP